MATVVFVHAHPDDDCIATGGTMAALSDAGHRVVLVFATRGELGEVPDGFLDDGETLTERRVREAQAGAEILGVARVVFLGYRDSGMAGDATNDDAEAFWSADVDEAADRLGAIVAEEGADLLVTYDERGGYGHPDHVQVHRLGAALAARDDAVRVLESTMNREHLLAGIRSMSPDDAPDAEAPDADNVGMPQNRLHFGVDVQAWLPRKREAMRAHRSQIADESFFLAMPAEMFAYAFGTEWYIRHGEGERVGDLAVGDLDTLLTAPDAERVPHGGS